MFIDSTTDRTPSSSSGAKCSQRPPKANQKHVCPLELDGSISAPAVYRYSVPPGLRRLATNRETVNPRGCRTIQTRGNLSGMSIFKVSAVVRNTKDESKVSQPIEVLVDSGSELSWLPKDVLTGIEVRPVRKRNFTTATKQQVTRETGYAIISAEGFETVDEVVFAEPSDMALLGVRTLEGFGVMVDNIAHRFVATTTLVAPLRITSLRPRLAVP